MNQALLPNFGLSKTFILNGVFTSYRGWCLKWVDDAGGVALSLPPRTGKARYAFDNELEAGRIRVGDSPENLWAVGFLDFTAGPYTVEGHVFFMKNMGNGKYEIRDSEVGSGARSAYGSIAELLGWFGAYKPKFIGWSTNCDGKEYIRENNVKPQETIVDRELGVKLLELWRGVGGNINEESALVSIIGKPVWAAIDTLSYSQEGQERTAAIAKYPSVVKERDVLKAKLDAGGDQYIKLTDVYIKK